MLYPFCNDDCGWVRRHHVGPCDRAPEWHNGLALLGYGRVFRITEGPHAGRLARWAYFG